MKPRWPGVNGVARYAEGLQVGYRWYDANNEQPPFPFGYGLSYTSFGPRHMSGRAGRTDRRGR
jgi:beta-glucosidase